jgi:hypothetical protein
MTFIKGSVVRALLREPLLHFAILGAALFVAYGRLAPARSDGSAVVVTQDQIVSIADRFRATSQRPPSRDELNALIDAHVRDEVFYREGLALGLDRDDPVVRIRVKQKMEVLSDEAMTAEPSDTDLQAYLDRHRAAFEIPAPLSFEQVYFDPDRHAERLVPDMNRTREALRHGSSATAVGDHTLLPDRMDRALPSEIAAVFGSAFNTSVHALPAETWSDPVRSSIGFHLVRVTWRGQSTVPTLAEAHDVVLREWTHQRTVEARERLYRTLRARYTVTIAPIPASLSIATLAGGRR